MGARAHKAHLPHEERYEVRLSIFFWKLRCSIPPRMDTYVYGQRAIWLQPSTDAVTHPERPPNTIEVVDFSLSAVLSAKDVPLMSPLLVRCKSSTLVPSSTIQLGRTPIFEDVVETHLPCVSTEWNLKQAYPLYMIYEDGIIGVDVCSQLSSSACFNLLV
jgi:hypothetical protein